MGRQIYCSRRWAVSRFNVSNGNFSIYTHASSSVVEVEGQCQQSYIVEEGARAGGICSVVEARPRLPPYNVNSRVLI